MKNVSVIIPAYNAELFIKQCLHSVLNQNHRDIEVIVVNDGSTDTTRALVEELAQSDGRIRLLNIDNSGRAKARNRGIEIAEGYWLAFLDADDYWRADKLSIQLDIADKTQAGLIYSQRVWVDENGLEQGGFSKEILPDGMVFPKLIEGNYLCTSTVLVKRDLVLRAGCFSEKSELKNCQDYDLWIRLSALAPFSASDDALIFYRLHGNNAHKNYKSRYIGMRACMDRLREVANNYPDRKSEYLKKIDIREAAICESYGVDLFKKKEFSLAKEALDYAQGIKPLSAKRRLVLLLATLFSYFVK